MHFSTCFLHVVRNRHWWINGFILGHVVFLIQSRCLDNAAEVFVKTLTFIIIFPQVNHESILYKGRNQMVIILRKLKIQSKGNLVGKIFAAYKYNLYIYSKFVYVLFLYIKVCSTCHPISKDLKFIDENSHYFITRCFMKYIIFIACYFII